MRSGSNAPMVDAPRGSEKPRGVAQLEQALLRREPQYPWHVREHVRADAWPRAQRGRELKARLVEQMRQGLPARTGRAVLDARDDGLRGACAARERALREPGTLPGGRQEPCCSGDAAMGQMIAIKLSADQAALL